jgi:hypothetical protein
LIRHGLIAGAAISVLMFAPQFLFGMRTEWMKVSELFGYTGMMLCLSATYFAMRRESAVRGGLGYGSALAVGVGVSTVAGVLFGITTWMFLVYSGDALPERLMEFYAMQIRDSGANAEVMAAKLKELEQMRPLLYNHPLQGVVMGATVFLIGVVESLLGAWLVSRAPRGRAVLGVAS